MMRLLRLPVCSMSQAQRKLTRRFLMFEAQNECFMDIDKLEREVFEMGFNDATDFMNEVGQSLAWRSLFEADGSGDESS
jgi:hypothetical protein